MNNYFVKMTFTIHQIRKKKKKKKIEKTSFYLIFSDTKNVDSSRSYGSLTPEGSTIGKGLFLMPLLYLAL